MALLLVPALILFILATVSRGQLSPHILVQPQTYHLGVTETISFTSYGSRTFEVLAQVLFTKCRCVTTSNGPTTDCSDIYHEFSSSRAMSITGEPIVLSLNMPGMGDILHRKYYIKVTADNGTVAYLERTPIHFNQNSFGFLLVKTDKPIYKPSQKVQFCVVFVDKALKPFHSDITVEVKILDAMKHQVLRFDTVIIVADSFACLDFPLSDEPNCGTWTIEVTLRIPELVGGCYSTFTVPQASCQFDVQEYVLPEFVVKLEGPKQLVRLDRLIKGQVSAKYIFGVNVLGTVRLTATLISTQRAESLLFYDVTAKLVDGIYVYSIPTKLYQDIVRYRYDPFCVKASIKIAAEVTTAGGIVRIAESLTLDLVANPISVKLSADNPSLFKPGLNYIVKAQASYSDGSPAANVEVELTVTLNNGEVTLFVGILTTDSFGLICKAVLVPSNANCLKITLSPVEDGSSNSCQESRICFSPGIAYSPSASFLTLSTLSSGIALQVGAITTIFAESTVPFEALHILVIAQGSLVYHTRSVYKNGPKTAQITFNVTHEMVPRVKILGLYVRIDGEIVADLIELNVQCKLKNLVTLQFSKSNAMPGDPISLRASTKAASLVLVSVHDKSLELLAKACTSIDTNSVCALLNALTGGSLPSGTSCQIDSGKQCCPSSCTNPAKYSVDSILNGAGILLLSNMYRPSPPYGSPAPENRDFANTAPAQGAVPSQLSPRTFFPESWIWHMQQADSNGMVDIKSKAPDTITSWVGEAFALHPQGGLGISASVELAVRKSIFISLQLPYSVNLKEILTINPQIFNLGLLNIQALLVVEVDANILILSPMPHQLSIKPGGSASFNLTVKLLAVGELSISIKVVGINGELDTIIKYLLVKPGCEKLYYNENVLAKDAGSYCFNYSLPACAVPGSAKAIISVTGGIISPALLDNLLVLPSGGGEQNLAKIATNYIIGLYLRAKIQLGDLLEVKITGNIAIGHQKQLSFHKPSGCFTAWKSGPCSVWLTAAVLDHYAGILELYAELKSSVTIVDVSVIVGAADYLLSIQLSVGLFPALGYIHNHELHGSEHLEITAFVVKALKHYIKACKPQSPQYQLAVQKAEEYIATVYLKLKVLSSYGLALSISSLYYNFEGTPSITLKVMLDDLKARIQLSLLYPGGCYLCRTRPGDSPKPKGDGCFGSSSSEWSAECVETTAYALIALLVAKDTSLTVCLASWLVAVRIRVGGLLSSQDTVVALQALALFNDITLSVEIHKTLRLNVPGLAQSIIKVITQSNKFDNIEIEIPQLPSNANCVSWEGTGTALVQSTLKYHGCSCCDQSNAFHLELATEKKGLLLQLLVQVRLLVGNLPIVAIVNVEIPSGYVYTGWKLINALVDVTVEKVELVGANVILYLNLNPLILYTALEIEFRQIFHVANPQPLPITVHNYHDPGATVTKYYLPENSPSLPKLLNAI